MEESKVTVVGNLETLLRSTRAYPDIHLEYVKKEVNGYLIYEYVIITMEHQEFYKKQVNVTANSGLAIIKDVMRVLD